MTSQPPLLDSTGVTMPGPQFTPRPGWGGQFRRWFSENAYRVLFRAVVLLALILIARSLWVNLPARRSSLEPSPTTSPVVRQETGGLTITADAGDGMTHLAARALDLYIAGQRSTLRIDAAQHLSAVDALARLVCWCLLEIGQEVTFAMANISSVIDRALNLTEVQHAAWERELN